MTVSRSTARTLLAAGGFALLVSLAAAQDPALPTKSGAAVDALNTYKEARGIPAGELKNARAAFASFAKYYADLVAHPTVYKAMQDPKIGATGPRVPTLDWDTNTGVLRDLERFIMVPDPANRIAANDPRPKVGPDQADYIRELGTALDAALKPLLEGANPERIVRVNAARVLASACKSGAHAHYPTVTALLKNANTPPEVKYYALEAAGNLLAAYDLVEYRVRLHSHGPKEVGELVQAVQECVTNPNALVPGLPAKVEEITPDQAAVVSFLRRQAIRALGQVRSASIPGPDGQSLYPAAVLARVCVSDPALGPAPSPSECAEAVIGLCNMAPVYLGNPIKEYNPDAVVEAMAVGLINFAKPRTNPTDRSLPWRGYSARLADAFRNWRPLFDPLFDPTRPTVFSPAATPARVNELIERAQAAILTPIDKVGLDGKPDLTATIDIQRMNDFVRDLRANPKRDPLVFRGAPATSIAVPERK
jgi:hypothetical protein